MVYDTKEYSVETGRFLCEYLQGLGGGVSASLARGA